MWKTLIDAESKKEYYKKLMDFINIEYTEKEIFPEQKNLFRAFDLCSFESTKVIILGQDPYHNINQANGLAFSVKKGNKIPPSLRNIFKELHNDLKINLQPWYVQPYRHRAQ